MLNLADLSRLKGFRFPRSVIGYAVWAYHRFALSLRGVEGLRTERGVTVSYETIRDWVALFGLQIAAKVRRDRPAAADKGSVKGSGHRQTSVLWRGDVRSRTGHRASPAQGSEQPR
jgi:transposase-like protein